MTNKEWLDYLAHNAPDELAAWFDAEHVETEERALDGDTESENADSRELILTDLEKKTREWHDYDGNYMRIYSGVAYAQMKELLDRQAAITERECRKPNWSYCETCEALEKLTAERDNLEADCEDWMKHAMAAENVCYETKQEREQYRKLFGMALDWAYEITMLESSIDEGMA